MAVGDILGIIKNRPGNNIINGGFDYWQRGTSFNLLASSGYAADRFICFDTAISQQAFITGQVSVPSSPKYFLRSDNTGQTSSFSSVVQRIEDIATVAGKRKVVSVYLNSAINGTIGVRGWYNFNSTTASRTVAIKPLNVTIGWKRYTIVIDYPAIASGEVLGAGNNAEICFDMVVGSGTQDTSLGYTSLGVTLPSYVGQLDFANMMMNDGPVAPEFERAGVNLANELSLCQRYYQVTRVPVDSYLAIYESANSYFRGSMTALPTTMRNAPIGSIQIIAGNNFWVIPGQVAFSSSSTAGISFATTAVSWQMNQLRQAGNSTPTSGNVYSYESDFFVIMDAEL